MHRLTSVVNRRTYRADGVYVGRPSMWGNPFVIGRDGTRDQVIHKYRVWLMDQPELLAAVPSLAGRALICWCSPQPCHADVLAELADSPVERRA
jgi:hypothetical protein